MVIGLMVMAPFCGRAVHVLFTFQSSDTTPQGLRYVALYPIGGPYTNGAGAIITRDRVSGTTGTNGQVIISNLYGLSYRGELQGTFTATTNYYTFPITNGLVNAADYAGAPTNANGIIAYSQAQADGRFVARDNGAALSNVVAFGLSAGRGLTNDIIWNSLSFRTDALLNIGDEQISTPLDGQGARPLVFTDVNLGGQAAIQAGTFFGNGSGITNLGFIYSTTNGIQIGVDRYLVTVNTNNSTNIFLDFKLGHQNGQSRGGISFSDAQYDGTYGLIYMVPDHDLAGSPAPSRSEMQITFPNNLAISAAYGLSKGHIQWGAANSPMWEYHQNQINIAPANTIGHSSPFTFQVYVSSPSGTASYITYPGIMSEGATINGVGGWYFYLSSDNRSMSSLGAGGEWDNNMANVRHGIQIYDTTNSIYRGTKSIGAQVLSKSSGTASSSTALNFGPTSCTDMSANGNSLSFYTTNALPGTTNYQRAVFIVRAAGFSPTLAYPAWCSNSSVSLPTALAPNQMLRLSLESVGQGETNVLVDSAQILIDQSFAYDQAVNEFMFRSGLSSLAISNALNVFVKTLKADSTWNQLDALYPFAGTTANQNKWNLISTNIYTIAFSGTITHGNGIAGNGSTGFGDTGWLPADQNNTSMFAWCSNFTSGAFLYVLGAQNAATAGSAFRNGANATVFQLGVNITVVQLNNNSTTPSLPNGFAGSRSASGSYNIYWNYGSSSAQSVASASPASRTAYVLARNNDGTADQFWDKTVQVVALGKAISQSQYQTLFSASTNLNAALGR